MSPLLVLIVAVLATTYAGPIVRFTTAPALAIAFWRLALVLPVTGGLAVWERSGERGAVLSQAPHGTAPRSLLPLIVLSGIALAVIGASLIGLGDARLSLGALGGDGLALLGAVTGAGYYVLGRRVRQTVGIWRYATGVYAVAAAALALLALARSTPLVGFAGRDWTVFGAMAAGPMLIGHTGMNYALRHFRATTVNVAALGEPVGASVIAWLVPAIHEVPPMTALVGGVLVLSGIALSLKSGNGKGETGNVGTDPHGTSPVSRFSFPGRGAGEGGGDAS